MMWGDDRCDGVGEGASAGEKVAGKRQVGAEQGGAGPWRTLMRGVGARKGRQDSACVNVHSDKERHRCGALSRDGMRRGHTVVNCMSYLWASGATGAYLRAGSTMEASEPRDLPWDRTEKRGQLGPEGASAERGAGRVPQSREGGTWVTWDWPALLSLHPALSSFWL